MILDKANEPVTAYANSLIDDGYGGTQPGKGTAVITFNAFALPVGFSGAGWAINSKIEGQGWADVARYRLLFKPIAGIHKWTHVEFQGREWSVVDDPRLTKGLRPRQQYMSVTVELKGEL